MEKINPDDFRVPGGKKVDLGKWPTKVKTDYDSKEEFERIHGKHIEKLSALQSLLYACDRYALLLIFQAMDAAGKDSVIKHVMSESIPKAAKSSVSNIRVQRNWNTIFCGTRYGSCPNGATLAYSIDLITRKC